MEERLIIPGKGVALEGRFLPGGTAGAAVITHPHPLYGGSMDNNVVWTARKAMTARGWSTLRFNFRGVGRSTGAYGAGEAEAEDVASALAFLQERAAGPYFVIGYSFGAAVAARALVAGLPADGAMLISPPIAFMDLDFLPRTPNLNLVVAGDQDELCPLADLRVLLQPRQPPVEIAVIPGADHFSAGGRSSFFCCLKTIPSRLRSGMTKAPLSPDGVSFPLSCRAFPRNPYG
jgi:uncharacterized protein